MTVHIDRNALRDDELFIERSFNAPAALVFRIWEDRDHMQRWLGPKEFTCTHLESDFRVGGKWRACIVSDEHGESWMSGEYRQIEKDKRIVYSFAWEGEDDAQYGNETIITVEFEEQEGRTVQRFHQTPLQSVESRDSHVEGWNESFDRERDYVEAMARDGLK